jgi:hypothetical protein
MFCGMLAILKSGGDPLVNVAGAYFPAWLACLLIGLIFTWGLQALASRSRFAEALKPGIIMVPALFVASTCGTWLLFFS